MNRRKEACHCRNVTYGMIEDAVRSGADTLQAVMDATGAGKGCGKCRDFLEYLIRDIREELDKRKILQCDKSQCVEKIKNEFLSEEM